MDIYVAVSNRKWKRKPRKIFIDVFTICSSCSLKLSFVRLLTKKQTEVIHLQMD